MTVVELLPPGLERAVSAYTGIVRSLDECLHATSDPACFRFACEVGRGADLLGRSLDHLSGIGGAGLTRAEAAAACVGEALERYSATYVPPERLVVASAAEIGDAAVAPERFALFSARQYVQPGFPFRPFRDDTPIPWVAGWSLPDRHEAWLPAELVFLADTRIGGGSRIGYATSSGLACASTRDEALVRGLCEVLERDAFMIVWSNKLSLRRLDWSDDARLAELDARLFAPTGLGYAVVDLSVFHCLPSLLGVIRAPAEHPGALGVGAGTAPTLERAFWKALSEAFSARSAGAKLALLDDRASGTGGPTSLSSFEDHIHYYADASRAAAAAFIDASPERVSARSLAPLEGETPAQHIAALCRRAENAGSTAYGVDVTSPDVAELGLVVTKVVTPELCMLDVVHAARFLGGTRLYAAAAERGLRSRPLAEDDVNPDPHPFP